MKNKSATEYYKGNGYIQVLLILLMIVYTQLSACSDEDQQPKSKPYPGKKWYPPSVKYPDGLAEIKMKDTLFRVPGEYIGKNPHDQAFFSVVLAWPELTPFKKTKRLNAKIDQNDLVVVRFRMTQIPPIQNPERFKTHWEERVSIYDGPYRSVEFPEFWEYRFKGRPILYRPVDINAVSLIGEPLLFSCRFFSTKINNESRILSTCGYVDYWQNGLSMGIKFSRKHLQDAMDIYNKIMILRESFITKESIEDETSNITGVN